MICDARNPPADIAGFDPTVDADHYWYDEEAAEKAVQFFPDCLQHTSGPTAGEPFHLSPWQADVTRTLFGWKHPDGRRRFREALIMVARKNGKTTWMAGIALYVLFCDHEAGAQCYCGASSIEQARLLFMTAEQMIRDSGTGLLDVCKITPSEKHIRYQNSFLKAIPANEGRAHGYNSHLIIGDELHAWVKREFWVALHTSTGARTQPLEVYISTAGWDRNSLCWDRYQYARQIRDRQIKDDAFLPVLYETQPDDDWTDPKVWRKANPNLGISVFEDYLHRECTAAKIDPGIENDFRRLHLNQWTQQEHRWIQMERWRECAVTDEPFAEGDEVFGGLDLSSNKDITAWVLAQRVDTGWKIRGHYWIPEETLREAERRDRVPYSKWVAAGYVTATPGRSVEYAQVHAHILADHDKYRIGAAGYDPWNAHTTRLLMEENGMVMHEMRQGVATLGGPCKELERAVLDETLDHGNDPVMEWMAGNAEVRADINGNIRPVKPEHGSSGKRIDGIVAAIMAIGTAQMIQPDGPSIYGEPGVGVL